MRRSQVYMDLALVMIALLIIGVYATLAVWFINELDRARLASASADWRNTAVLLANRLVYSPNCLGYIKSAAIYTNDSEGNDLMIIDQVNPPSTIDERKFNINRLTDCLLMDSPEFRVYFKVKIEHNVYDNAASTYINEVIFEEENLDPLFYRNQRTLERITIPVKIIHPDDSITYGVVSVELSVNMEYFEMRIV